MGTEIDILATNRKKNIWVEVSVSTNPRCNYRKDIRFESTINEYLRDFDREDKNEMARKYFPKSYEKWLIYGKLALPREEIERFEPALQSRGIKAVYFGNIFKALRDLKGYRLDAPRGYMNLFDAFHNESI